MAHFIALTSLRGPVPDDFAAQPPPDPTMFGMPTEDDGSRDDLMLGSNLLILTHHRPDIEALRAARRASCWRWETSRTVSWLARAAEQVAALLGATAVSFPSHHGGFLGGEYGQTGEPEAFAARLREVFADTEVHIS